MQDYNDLLERLARCTRSPAMDWFVCGYLSFGDRRMAFTG